MKKSADLFQAEFFQYVYILFIYKAYRESKPISSSGLHRGTPCQHQVQEFNYR